MAKILLVEDDNNLREIYEARLQAEGYTIVSARDGEEALVVAKAEKPDLVISDVMMPKISGFEMLDILRNTEGLQDVKVIMLTALGQSDDQKRADKLGADRYLVKSQVTLEDIVKAAQTLLEGDSASATETPVALSPAAPDQKPTVQADPVKAAPDDKPAADEAAGAGSDTAHDKLMADALDTLVADTDKPSGVPAQPKKDEEPKESKESSDKADEAESKPKKSAEDEAPSKKQKVIEPLQAPPHKDIQTLLAEEEAKESGVTTPDADSNTATAKEADTDEAAVAKEADADASTTADEEAAVDAKIEDFVAGATTEPSTPEEAKPAATTEPAATAEKKIAVSDGTKPAEPAAEAKAPEAKDSPDPNSIAL